MEGVDQHRHFPEIGGLQLAFPQLCGNKLNKSSLGAENDRRCLRFWDQGPRLLGILTNLAGCLFQQMRSRPPLVDVFPACVAKTSEGFLSSWGVWWWSFDCGSLSLNCLQSRRRRAYGECCNGRACIRMIKYLFWSTRIQEIIQSKSRQGSFASVSLSITAHELGSFDILFSRNILVTNNAWYISSTF